MFRLFLVSSFSSWQGSKIPEVLQEVQQLLFSIFSIFESPIIHSLRPQSLHKPLFSNAPGSTAFSQEHLKTKTYAKFGGHSECIMRDSKIVNSSSHLELSLLQYTIGKIVKAVILKAWSKNGRLCNISFGNTNNFSKCLICIKISSSESWHGFLKTPKKFFSVPDSFKIE